MWFFQEEPGVRFLFLTARVLRPSFERRRNQRCLIPLVKAIRVLVRNSPKSHRARPGSSFSASVARVCYGDADQTALRSTSYPAAFIASATAYIQLFPESYCTYKIPLRSEGSSTPDSYTTQTRSRPSRLKKNPISKITFCLAQSFKRAAEVSLGRPSSSAESNTMAKPTCAWSVNFSMIVLPLLACS